MLALYRECGWPDEWRRAEFVAKWDAQKEKITDKWRRMRAAASTVGTFLSVSHRISEREDVLFIVPSPVLVLPMKEILWALVESGAGGDTAKLNTRLKCAVIIADLGISKKENDTYIGALTATDKTHLDQVENLGWSCIVRCPWDNLLRVVSEKYQ